MAFISCKYIAATSTNDGYPCGDAVSVDTGFRDRMRLPIWNDGHSATMYGRGVRLNVLTPSDVLKRPYLLLYDRPSCLRSLMIQAASNAGNVFIAMISTTPKDI